MATVERICTAEALAGEASSYGTTSEMIPVHLLFDSESTVGKAASKSSSPINRALNVYLGLIGKSYDVAKETLYEARQDPEKMVSDLEIRGERLRCDFNDSLDELMADYFNGMFGDPKEQLQKVQDYRKKGGCK